MGNRSRIVGIVAVLVGVLAHALERRAHHGGGATPSPTGA